MGNKKEDIVFGPSTVVALAASGGNDKATWTHNFNKIPKLVQVIEDTSRSAVPVVTAGGAIPAGFRAVTVTCTVNTIVVENVGAGAINVRFNVIWNDFSPSVGQPTTTADWSVGP